jgi:glyoxylase-like metal-dependent hydrolase (beta-lactamase superfamily II)
MTGDIVQVDRIVVGTLAANCYLIASAAGDAVIVDPGDGFESIAHEVAVRELRVRGVIATHAHHDHVGAVADVVDAYGAPFHLHPADDSLLRRANFFRSFLGGEPAIRVPAVDVALADCMQLRFGTLEIAVLHAPGHTPGGVCLEAGGELFAGDTLLARHETVDLPGSDRDALEASVARLAERASPGAIVRPGHGDPAPLAEVLASLGPSEVRR